MTTYGHTTLETVSHIYLEKKEARKKVLGEVRARRREIYKQFLAKRKRKSDSN